MTDIEKALAAAEHAVEDQMASDDNHPANIARAAVIAFLEAMPATFAIDAVTRRPWTITNLIASIKDTKP